MNDRIISLVSLAVTAIMGLFVALQSKGVEHDKIVGNRTDKYYEDISERLRTLEASNIILTEKYYALKEENIELRTKLKAAGIE